MPKISRNDKGQLVKSGTNGCEECGFESNNEAVIDESVVASVIKPTAKKKAPTKKTEVNNDDS